MNELKKFIKDSIILFFKVLGVLILIVVGLNYVSSDNKGDKAKSGTSTVGVKTPGKMAAKTASKDKFSYSQLFYSKLKTGTSKGTSKVQGYATNESSKQAIKDHCKKQYKGYTVCFYYKNMQDIMSFSTLPIMKAVTTAEKTDYFARVDISVDGRHVDYTSKKK
jgi:hypothetical protein